MQQVTSPVQALPHCACGTDRKSRNAVPHREYSTRGTLYALWGGTPVPIRVVFRCVLCDTAFDECKDRAGLRAFIL